jgi:predicted DNA-binding protein (MmcQ/YjbR family)
MTLKSDRFEINVTEARLLNSTVMNHRHNPMIYDEFNDFCRLLPATSYVMQWGGSHVWKVGGKLFAVGGWGNDKKPAYSFKVSENNFHFLANKPGYRSAPYLASRGLKWIQQCTTAVSEDEALKHYLEESHRIVSSGLSKKKQRELGLNGTE